MKLEKKQIRGIAFFAIILVVYNILAFVIPFPKNGCLWAAWAFGLVAILLQIPILLLAFRNGETVKSKFYGFPIARVGVIYLIAQMIVTVLFFALAFVNCPAWIPVVISVLVLAAGLLGVIATDAARDEIERQEKTVKVNTSFMKTLTVDAQTLLSRAKSEPIKNACKKVFEAVRYSDPMSADALSDVESRIRTEFDSFTDAVISDNADAATASAEELLTLLKERNSICKMEK